jgi:hypothetical protein
MEEILKRLSTEQQNQIIEEWPIFKQAMDEARVLLAIYRRKWNKNRQVAARDMLFSCEKIKKILEQI